MCKSRNAARGSRKDSPGPAGASRTEKMQYQGCATHRGNVPKDFIRVPLHVQTGLALERQGRTTHRSRYHQQELLENKSIVYVMSKNQNSYH